MGKGGRLSFSHELLDQICLRLERGETMADICAEPPMPKVSTIQYWMAKDVKAKEKITSAREAGEEAIASNTRKIARGIERFSSGDVQRDKLTVDTDLRLLAFWNPKKYSERKQLDMNVTVNLEQLIMQAYAPAIEAPVIEAPVIDNEEDEPLW